jgi:hypothetical protein
MEDELKKKEDDLKKNGRRPQKKLNGRQPPKKNGRRPTKTKKNGRRPEVQFKKSTLIGCDIIVN